MPSRKGTIYLDKGLTKFSIRYANLAFIADKIAPIIKVPQTTGQYYVYGKQNFRSADDTVSSLADTKFVDALSYSTESFTTLKHALADYITDEDREDQDAPINIELDTTENLTEKLLLRKEIRVSTLVTTTANYASGMYATLSGDDQFDSSNFDSNGTPIVDRIDAAKTAIRKATGAIANTIIIPSEVAQVVARDTAVLARIKETHTDLLTDGGLPPTLFNLKVLEPASIYNSADEDASSTFTGADVWGKDLVVCYIAPNVRSKKIMTLAMAFEQMSRRTDRWREDIKDADVIRVKNKCVEKMTGTACGYVYKAVIS